MKGFPSLARRKIAWRWKMNDVHSANLNRSLGLGLAGLYLLSLFGFLYANWRVEPEHNLWMHAANTLIISIPLVLFYGSLYVLIRAWRERSLSGYFSPQLAKVIHWAPRLASLLIIFFISLFSLDVLMMEAAPVEKLMGFLIHSTPSIIMLVMLVIAWRKPVLGFVTFLLAGLVFLTFVVRGQGLGHFLLFSGPLLLISALFYADWRWKTPAPPPSVEQTA
jgi:hypothetical protein